MKRKGLGLTLLTAGVLSLSLAFSGGEVNAADKEDTINKGVIIGTTDVSGMTAEEAVSAVQKEAAEELEDKVTLTVGSSKVEASAAELGMSWSNQEVVDEALGLGKSGNIVKRYKDNKDLENHNKTYAIKYEADKETIKSYLQSQKEELDCEAVEGSLSKDEYGEFVIEPGVTGIVLNVNKSVKKVYQYMDESWKGDGGEVELVADEDIPRGTEEELSQVKDVLGTATTYYGSTYQRNTNVEVGASKINGALLYPGESYSVTAAVTPFDAENGYELAPSYESGKVVDTYGGGICQVSTTLYNAVLKSELEVLERHNHTMTVSYVDPSKDAAIAEGLMDFQFANNTDAPIYIEGYGYGGELTFTIYGKEYRSSDRTVTYESRTISTTEPSGVKLYARSDANVGYLSQTQSPHTGLVAQLWKIVTENGETTETQVNSSTYQATPASYDVGISSSDPNVVAQLQTAIANNDLAAVQSILAGGTGNTGESEQEESESGDETQEQSETQQQSETQPETKKKEEMQAPTESEPQVETPSTDQLIDPPEPDDLIDIPTVEM